MAAIIPNVERSSPCLLQVRGAGRVESVAPTGGLCGPRPHLVEPSISSGASCLPSSRLVHIPGADQDQVAWGVHASLPLRPSACLRPNRGRARAVSGVGMALGVSAARGVPVGVRLVVLVVLYIQQIDYMSIQYNTIPLPFFVCVDFSKFRQGTLSELTRPRGGRLQGTI